MFKNSTDSLADVNKKDIKIKYKPITKKLTNREKHEIEVMVLSKVDPSASAFPDNIQSPGANQGILGNILLSKIAGNNLKDLGSSKKNPFKNTPVMS